MGRDKKKRKAARKSIRQAKGPNGIDKGAHISLADRLQNAAEIYGQDRVQDLTGLSILDIYNVKSGAKKLTKLDITLYKNVLDLLKNEGKMS